MATIENLPSPSTERPIGFGRLKRKEDARFIRGQGTYLDDIKLPGMVHGALLRSPYAHAKIVSIDTSRALAHPNVAAVVTAKDLETLGLAWMPTISYDTQAVLAGDKVRFQGQEVAFVIATDEYSANDALRADRRRVRAAAGDRQRAQGARRRRAADPRRQGGPARQPGQPDLGGRRRGGHRPRLRRGRHRGQPRHHLPALPPGAAGDVRHHRRLQPADRAARHLQRQPGAARAPHGVRARRRARRAHDPHPLPGHRRRLRQQGARLPGLRLRDRRLDRGRRAGEVGREPLREPDVDRLRPRLRHARARCAPRTARSPACASTSSPTTAPSTAPPSRPSSRPASSTSCCGSYDLQAVARQGQGGLHQQGARRRGLPLLVPDHRGRLPGRAHGRRARPGDGGRPDRPAHAQLHRAGAVPLRDDDRLDLRLGQLRRDDAGRDGHRRLRGPAPRAGREARPRRADGDRRSPSSPRASAPARASTWTSSGWR